jgi:aminopeptidase N
MIPNTDRANKYTYAFLSHETAHQWWGNIVSWRSYRDQWLSEGFAEYSAVLYTKLRQNPKAAVNLVDQMRRSLQEPPITQVRYGSGTLNDIGPIILGHRLSTRKSFGAYQALIYDKGALVLRMLHFLMSDPANNDDKAFFAMMKDFVERYRNGVASSDDFRMVANQHFARTPIAQRYHLTDLNWFFQQWVYKTEMPAYKLDYQIENQPDGAVVVTGNITQDKVSDNFFMVLPLIFTFGDGKFAGSTVAASGPKTPFKIKLAARPSKVDLDPQKWVLSEKTN